MLQQLDVFIDKEFPGVRGGVPKVERYREGVVEEGGVGRGDED